MEERDKLYRSLNCLVRLAIGFFVFVIVASFLMGMCSHV